MMKIFLLALAVFAVGVNADCKDEVLGFDCAGKGEPFYVSAPGVDCSFGCKQGDVILSCPQVHSAPNTDEYESVACKGKATPFDCHSKGYPYWIEVDDRCDFSCMVGGDMLFTCEQIWPAQH